MVEKWCHQAVVRLATVPPKHPLHKPVSASKGKNIKRHRSPLHNLFDHVSFVPKRMEKIPAKPRDPALLGKLPFTVSIPLSKEASIQEDQYAPESTKVYSDGSAHNGKVGAAAVLIHPDKPQRKLHFHLGPESKHTVHEAELIGITLALHLIQSERSKNDSFAIGTDNQATLEAFHSSMRKPAHYAAREILRLGTTLRKRT